MKPAIFLGSSVEGLSVAYSIQTNLIHDANLTIWSQGVFDLSKTTIESLFEMLDVVDFAIFVFTPDDLLKIREKTALSVRDNVLFEFGLFLGKLGRERVYFIVPSNHDLHLPTDLLGITPGKYDSEREDGNMVAATGAVSHQVRLMIKKYGPIQQIEETSNIPERLEKQLPELHGWYRDMNDNKFEEAIQKLDVQILKQTDKSLIIGLKTIKAICQYRLDEKNIKNLNNVLSEYPDDEEAHLIVGKMYLWENFIDQAIKIFENCRKKFGDSPETINFLISCYLRNEDRKLAIEVLKVDSTANNVDNAIILANIYIEDKDFENARNILHKAYLNFPNNQAIWEKYATVANELKLNKVGLLFYSMLSGKNPENSTYKAQLGNSCLDLNLNDLALTCYQEASKLVNDSEEWILSNIGNILKNRGFYSEGIKYLRKGVEINNSSEYALDRLSTSLKLKDEEQKTFNNLIKEGRKLVKDYNEILSVV